MRARVRLLGLVVVVAAWVVVGVAHGAALEVTSLNDTTDTGTLRTALSTANSNGVADTITFAAGLAGGTINLDKTFSALHLTEANTTIDGDINNDGKPDIAIDAQYGPQSIYVDTNAKDCVIRGLCLNRFRNDALYVSGSNCVIVRCYIGTDLSGRKARPNGNNGIFATTGDGLVVGGAAAMDRNVISGNLGSGIYLNNVGSAWIANLICGLGSDGGTMLPNASYGIYGYNVGGLIVGLPGLPVKTVISGNSSAGINVYNALAVTVANCRVGTNLTGNQPRPNGSSGISLNNCNSTVIGLTSALAWNLISGNASYGLYADNCPDIKIKGNRIGTDTTGQGQVPNGNIGVYLSECHRAYVGGTVPAAKNVIASNGGNGLYLSGSLNAWVVGNLIGVSRDGTKALPNSSDGVYISGCSYCTIGGGAATKRNVITSRNNGISIGGYNSTGNKVQGNYIGWLPDGTTQAPCSYGVYVGYGPAGVTVGGTGALGNKVLGRQYGVSLDNVRGGCIVQGNTIGAPIGTKAVGSTGIGVYDASAKIIGNNILQQSNQGINVSGSLAMPVIAGNTIRKGAKGIYITNDASPNLGRLNNASTDDDGGNVFIGQTDYAIYNETQNAIRAEGNDFGSTVASVIDGKIYDEGDSSYYGFVDYTPLLGGVIPSAARTAGALSVAAVPTKAGGAQIVVTLAGAAEVQAEILNVAGRTVRVLPPAQGQTGVNSLLWDGRSGAGTKAPAGVYLCRVVCRAPEGQQQAVMARLQLER